MPILVVFAVVFLGIMGWLLRLGFGTTGSAFGPSVPAQQGDAEIRATPAPIGTEPPGTFTIPQTGTGPVANRPSALPGQSTGGGPPAPVMAEVQSLQQRIARNPKDLAALVAMGGLEMQAQKFDKAADYLQRALALDPGNPDVRTDYANALHENGRDLDALAQVDKVLAARADFPPALYTKGLVLAAIGRRTDAAATLRRFLQKAPAGDPRTANAKAVLQRING